ncbi:MAG: hypothetical protein JWM86_427 [Thermoleophilia bacterium]|nr:hypothetical protein [Thermoleophilia bacterium]
MGRLRTIDATADLRSLVKQLATEHGGDRLTLYVDLDPHTFSSARERRAELARTIDRAARCAPDRRWGALVDEVRTACDAVGDALGDAQGLLIYAEPGGDVTMVKLPHPVAERVEFAPRVPVRPLLDVLPRERWCVLLINRRATRLLLGDRIELEEVAAWKDDVNAQRAGGGDGTTASTQGRNYRQTDEQVRDHVRETMRDLRELHDAHNFDRLLIAAPHELRGLVQDELHNGTRGAMAGFLDLDVEHSSISDVARCASSRITEFEDEQMDRLLAGFEQNAGRDERAAQALDEVLEAICEHRVGTLIIAEGYARPGWQCAHEDWLSRRSGTCPIHGEPLHPIADVVEAAIEQAIATGAEVSTVRRIDDNADPSPDGSNDDREQFSWIERLGSIVAILRFDLDEAPPETT